jgi:hypothetical protein
MWKIYSIPCDCALNKFHSINNSEPTDVSSWHLVQRQGFDLNSRDIILNFVQDTEK